MKYLVFVLVCVSSCAAPRVLVRDCQDLQGLDMKNCELIKKM